MDFAKERAVAIEAVSLACSLTLKVFHRLVQGEVLTKGTHLVDMPKRRLYSDA